MQALLVTARARIGDALRDLLALEGYGVTLCGVAAAAPAACRERAFPLILLDRWLPDGDGLALCRVLRRLRGAEHAVVLILTPAPVPADLAALLDVGADDWLPAPAGDGPLDPDHLRACLVVADRLVAERAGRSDAEV